MCSSINNAKCQIGGIKAAIGAVEGTVDGTLDEAQAAKIDASVYGDRTQWIARADAARAPYNK